MRPINSRAVAFAVTAAALTVCGIAGAIVCAVLLPGEEHGTHDPASHDEFAAYLPPLQETVDSLHAIGARNIRHAEAVHRNDLTGHELAINAERVR